MTKVWHCNNLLRYPYENRNFVSKKVVLLKKFENVNTNSSGLIQNHYFFSDVHLTAINCDDGMNFGHINITDYGIAGMAAPYSAYKIEYKCTLKEMNETKCEDSDAKYCKKNKKMCKKNKDVQEKCPMTCNMCDENDDGDDGMDKCEDSDAKYCKKNKKQCKKNKDVQEKCPMTCDMCEMPTN